MGNRPSGSARFVGAGGHARCGAARPPNDAERKDSELTLDDVLRVSAAVNVTGVWPSAPCFSWSLDAERRDSELDSVKHLARNCDPSVSGTTIVQFAKLLDHACATRVAKVHDQSTIALRVDGVGSNAATVSFTQLRMLGRGSSWYNSHGYLMAPHGTTSADYQTEAQVRAAADHHNAHVTAVADVVARATIADVDDDEGVLAGLEPTTSLQTFFRDFEATVRQPAVRISRARFRQYKHVLEHVLKITADRPALLQWIDGGVYCWRPMRLADGKFVHLAQQPDGQVRVAFAQSPPDLSGDERAVVRALRALARTIEFRGSVLRPRFACTPRATVLTPEMAGMRALAADRRRFDDTLDAAARSYFAASETRVQTMAAMGRSVIGDAPWNTWHVKTGLADWLGGHSPDADAFAARLGLRGSVAQQAQTLMMTLQSALPDAEVGT